MSIGNKMLELRKAKGWSQETLADKLNVTRQTISKWELDETTPDIKQSKEISKLFNISLDELVDNDIKSVIVEKVSNTEKLAGIVLKLLKIAGVIFISIFVLMIIGLVCVFVSTKQKPSNTKVLTQNCQIADSNYKITIGDGDYFKCDGCDQKMQVYLKDITDWANLDQSKININKYFNDNGGTCN